MFEIFRENASLAFKLSAQPLYMGRVAFVAVEFIKEYGINDYLGAIVVIRELLSNAIHHGNRNTTEGEVSLQVKYLENNCFQIVVEDSGNGFDYDSINRSLPEDPLRAPSRGYPLIHNISDRVEFNDKGNRITAYLSLGRSFL